MASIYESPGQQVALTGSQTTPSFQPGVAYDPSRMMLQQSEQDLRAFAQFSDLLSRTLTERAKEENENQKNLGIADIVNGRMTPSQQQLEKFNKDKALLQAANDSNREVIAQVGSTNPDLAESLYQEAPAAKGWRAYGQAIGKARVAASGLEAFMSDFMAGTDPTVPGPDGVLFAPARASSRAQLEASWEVGIKQYAQRAGLGNLNPVIIAAELTPIAMRTRSEMLGMQMQQIITTREANEREDLRGTLSQEATLIGKDPTSAQNVIFSLNDKLTTLNKGNRQKANIETNEMMESLIRTLNDQDPALAGQVLQNYNAALINPNNPKLGTYGQRFAQKELSDLIRTTTDRKEEDQSEALKDEANGIVEVFYNNRTPATYREALKALGTLPQTQEVRAIIEQLVNNGPDYDPQRADQLGVAAANLKELDALKAQGLISSEIYDRESNRFQEEKAVKDLFPPDSAILGQIKANWKNFATDSLGDVPEFFDNATALGAQDLMGYIKATIEAELKNGTLDAKGSSVNNRIAQLVSELDQDYIIKDKTGKVTGFSATSRNLNLKGAVVWPAGGKDGNQSGRVLVDLVQSRVPRVTSAVKDTIIRPERWEAAIDSLSNGNKVPADVEFAAKTAGVSVPEFLRRQTPAGKTYDANAIQRGNKVYQENRAVSPRLAELIANPRTTPRMRDQYQIELQRLKQNQMTPSDQSSLPLSTTPFSGVLSLLRSGEGGWDSANRGIAGDTPGGIPGLSKMTLGQWKQYQSQGYNALGAYQFIPRTLDLAAREAGISSSTVMTPAVQDRLAVQLMIGSKRPTLADYLRGKTNDVNQALDDLALEWASVATRGGGTAYPNQGGNRASIGRDKARKVLEQARATFLSSGASLPTNERWMQDLGKLPRSQGTLPPPPP
jgi:hypothetical protein